jgi:proteasome beta subunit
VGSGSSFARGSLKKRYRADVDAAGALPIVVEALFDAADDDSATGGPDAARGIYPVVAIVTRDGARVLSEDEVAPIAGAVAADRGASAQGGGS